MPHSSSAITLTYEVSPRPFSYQALFAMLLVDSASKTSSPAMKTVFGWVSTLLDTVEERLARTRQSDFERLFSRQLEGSSAKTGSSRVLVSISCALISDASAHCGVLWVTPLGIYFRSNAGLVNSLLAKQGVMEGSRLDKEEWGKEDSTIKLALPFRDIVSFLPSVALATSDENVPFVTGIPNLIVAPNALQVFTVSPPQIYQFVYLRNVSVSSPSAVGPSSLLTRQEYNSICALPKDLDAVTCIALSERLWEARLAELQLPLLRDGVRYADPH